MNTNNYQKIVHCAMWFGNKLALSKVLKESWHKGYWGDVGGKVEKGELPFHALKREIQEETGMIVDDYQIDFIDCFVFPKREIKTFIFECSLMESEFSLMKHTEPSKLGPWMLFTKEQALKKRIMPSVRYYLKNG